MFYVHAELSSAGADDQRDRDLERADTSCVAVIQDGELVHEGYWNGGGPDVPVRTYSITESLTSVLVAMAAGDGALTLDDAASEQVDEWRTGPAGDVTVRDLLSMTSGREWRESTDRQLIRNSRDQTAYAVGLQQRAAPGEWVYDNSAPQVLERPERRLWTAVVDECAGTGR